MPRFFVPVDDVAAGRGAVRGEDAAHLARSLRARSGEEIVLVDPTGVEHGLRLDTVGPELCAGRVLWSRPSEAEPRLRVTVVQAIPQQGMDEAVEAMAQVGVDTVVPVTTARTVVRLDPARAARRTARWRALAREAAGLAHRGRVPLVGEVTELGAALSDLPTAGRLLVAVPAAQTALTSLRPQPAVPLTVVVGPEGGLDPDERRLLLDAGAVEVHLGPRVLPSRLAGAVAVALLLSLAGDLDAGVPGAPGDRRPGLS